MVSLTDEEKVDEYDLIIIGAGPAGLFCAINSFGKDKRILVLEKNASPGRKLLVSGSGHCNITHDGDKESFLDHYGDHGRFLRPAILGFGNRDLISFFEGLGVGMIHQEEGKIFPKTMKSRDVLDALIKECRLRNIHLRCSQKVRSIVRSEERFRVVTMDQTYLSRLLVIATGGCSYPSTGSTGDGFEFARVLGHKITEIRPALTPVYIKDYPFSDLAGISFPDIDISLHRDRMIMDRRGDLLFTHEGLSGPGILDLSRYIRADDTLRLSLVQGKRRDELDKWLQDKIQLEGTKGMRSVLSDLALPSRLITRILEILDIPLDLKCAHLTRKLRSSLVDCLTGFPLMVEKLGGFEVAMVTRGGVELNEVNSKTMESRLVGGLYLVGEVLDVDGDTGGYNLQAAFSTAILASRSILLRWVNQ